MFSQQLLILFGLLGMFGNQVTNVIFFNTVSGKSFFVSVIVIVIVIVILVCAVSVYSGCLHCRTKHSSCSSGTVSK